MAEASDASNQILQSIIENIRVTDVNSTKADFIASILENLGLLDLAITSGWVRINDDESNIWNAINNTETNTWSFINNTETNTWVLINNT
jgi:hypothetical protein